MKKYIFVALLSAVLIFQNNFYAMAAPNDISLEDPSSDSLEEIPNDNYDFDNNIIEENDLEEQNKNSEENIENSDDNTIPEINDNVRDSTTEVIVPIYNYDIDNVLVPTTYAMSLNPYKLPIALGNGSVSTDQVVSWKYGIVNKSTTDKIVTITFIVEDLNNQITFVDSAEAAENANEDVYAVYLTIIPADENGISIAGEKVNQDILSSELSNVEMSGAIGQAAVLHAGENHIAFKLSKAIYDFNSTLISVGEEKPQSSAKEILKLTGLNPDEKSATAFTFSGIMNSKANWSKLTNGIKITAIYDYTTATDEKEIIAGTHAMISVD